MNIDLVSLGCAAMRTVNGSNRESECDKIFNAYWKLKIQYTIYFFL